MYEVHVREFMNLFKEDVRVLVNNESNLEQLYYGTVKEIPQALYDKEVKSQCFDFEGDEPLIAILVH